MCQEPRRNFYLENFKKVEESNFKATLVSCATNQGEENFKKVEESNFKATFVSCATNQGEEKF